MKRTHRKIIFIVFWFLSLGGIFIISAVFFLIWNDTKNPYKNTIEFGKIPKFNQLSLDDGHFFDGETSLPMRGSTLIDIDNDGTDEIFLGGGAGQDDQIFKYTGSDFIEITSEFNIFKSARENTLGASSVDLDNNGFSDIIVSRDDRVTVYYNSGGVFEPQDIETGLQDDTSPLGLSFGDIDKDGDLDLFIAGYIKRELMNGLTNFSPGYGGKSALLLNNGDKTFSNITDTAGLDYIHNTFQGIFVDLDNDTYLDLVVAYDTGEPRIYKNRGNLTFALQNNPYTEKFAYPMGIAVGDYDNDGDSDVFFSNIGSSLPKFMVKGDIEDVDDLKLNWFLLKNNGDFQFEDVAEEAQVKNFEFSWGAVFTDMNNDSMQDLIVAENYVDLAFHKLFKLPGRFLLQKDDNTFVATGKTSLVANEHFGITPLVSDFNQDGRQDLVWLNIAEESYAYIQNTTNENNYFNIRFPETAEYIGAGVNITLNDKSLLYDSYITGEGLAGDQSSTLHFGLGQGKSIEKIDVRLVSGKQIVVSGPSLNTTLNIADYE